IRSAVSAPTTKTAPGNSFAFSAKVGARVSHSGAFQANCASRRRTSSPGSGGLSALTTVISNAAGAPARRAAPRQEGGERTFLRFPLREHLLAGQQGDVQAVGDAEGLGQGVEQDAADD